MFFGLGLTILCHYYISRFMMASTVVVTLANEHSLSFYNVNNIYVVSIWQLHHSLLGKIPSADISNTHYINRFHVFQQLCSLYAKKSGQHIFNYTSAVTPSHSETKQFFAETKVEHCITLVMTMEKFLCEKTHIVTNHRPLHHLPFSVWIASLCQNVVDFPINFNSTPPSKTARHKAREHTLRLLISQEEKETQKLKKMQNNSKKTKNKKIQSNIKANKAKEFKVVECLCSEHEITMLSESSFYCQCEGFRENDY